MTYENPNALDAVTEDLLSALLYPRLFKRHLHLLEFGDSERILEVGCGGGGMTRQLALAMQDGTAITCVDLLGYWLERARKRVRKYGTIVFLEGDISNVKLPYDDYTLVFVHYMLHDVPRRHRAAIASRLAGVMAPGGRLFICEPTKDSHGMPPQEIDETFRAAGLKKIEGATDSFPIMGAMYRALFKKQ